MSYFFFGGGRCLQSLTLFLFKVLEKGMAYFMCPVLPKQQPKFEETLRLQGGSGDRVKTVNPFQGISRSLFSCGLENGQPNYRQTIHQNSGDGL